MQQKNGCKPIFGMSLQQDLSSVAKLQKSFSEKQLFPEKNSTELHSGNIVMMK